MTAKNLQDILCDLCLCCGANANQKRDCKYLSDSIADIRALVPSKKNCDYDGTHTGEHEFDYGCGFDDAIDAILEVLK